MKKGRLHTSLSEAISAIKSVWDNEQPDKEPFWKSEFEEESLLERLGQVFCCGPYYFYVFDFTQLRFLKISKTAEELIDIDRDSLTLDAFLARIHLGDTTHFQACERVVGDFLFQRVNSEDILNYKVSYFFRLRQPNGKYSIFHHQTIALSLDQSCRIQRVFGIHTNVDHLFRHRPNVLSFMHLRGGASFLEVDPFYPVFDRKEIKPVISKRECQILELFAQGLTDGEVGAKISLSPNTIRTHRDKIRFKLGAKNTAHAVALALKQGII